jgi:hypothetical protein
MRNCNLGPSRERESAAVGTRDRARAAAIFVAFVLAFPASLAAQQVGDITFRITGTLLTNFWRNSSAVNNSDVPTVARPHSSDTPAQPTLGMTIRQTRLGFVFGAPALAGADVTGEIDVDFFGGQQPSGGGRTHPLLRLRRAFAELRWSQFALLIGQEAPLLFEPNPSSLASVGFPLFASSGNLWLWLPQVRASVATAPAGRVRLALQGAVMAPSSGQPQESFLTEADAAERSGRPALEGRVALEWGEGAERGDIGVGAHLGWIETDVDEDPTRSNAIGVSARVPIGSMLELRGEAFSGRGLAGLGGGGIGQTFSVDTTLVDTMGGWTQLLLRPNRSWELGIGGGFDDPEDEDLTAAGPRENRTWSVHATWRPASLAFSLEFRQVETTFASAIGVRRNGHVNLAMGVEF